MRLTALLWVTVLVVAGCGPAAPPNPPVDGGARGGLSLTAAALPTLVLLTPDEPAPCPAPTLQAIPSPIRLPRSAPYYALLSLTRHTHTTIVALDARGAEPLMEPQVMGEIQLSADGDVLAYEVLADIDPLNNVVVVAHLTTDAAWRIAPGDGCAVFGFTLDAKGERLALLQVAMRGQLRPAPWQVSLVDLVAGRVSALGPARPQAVAFEPVAWPAATDEIVLRAFVPFQADGAAGLWAARADGARLRLLLPETEYVGRPALSPDGRRLAFLASEPENLPAEYVASPGEPPANALRVLDLVTGDVRTLAADAARAFDGPAWDAEGEHLYVSRGVWRNGARWFDQIVSLSVSHSTPEEVVNAPAGIVGLKPCAGGGLAYVASQEQGAVVRWQGRDAATPPNPPVNGGGWGGWPAGNGAVEILACR